MLSKKQFNAATGRLQDALTTTDLLSMLRHQLTQKNKDNQHSDLIMQLGELSTQFKDKTPLDRRRAENYLAKSLYGKNHSQIAHLLPKSDKLVSDYEFGMKAKHHGSFIEYFSSGSCFGDDVIDDHVKKLAKGLRESSSEDFHISYQGFYHPARLDRNFEQYNALMFLEFLDLEVIIEFVFTWRTDDMEPISDCIEHVTINNQSTEHYAKLIGYTDTDIDEEDVSSFFMGIASKFAFDKANQPKDFYCTRYPKEKLLKHKWALNLIIDRNGQGTLMPMPISDLNNPQKTIKEMPDVQWVVYKLRTEKGGLILNSEEIKKFIGNSPEDPSDVYQLDRYYTDHFDENTIIQLQKHYTIKLINSESKNDALSYVDDCSDLTYALLERELGVKSHLTNIDTRCDLDELRHKMCVKGRASFLICFQKKSLSD